MADADSGTDIPIYVGTWTNWSRGRVLGATLTLTHHNGALLTAFLALFVSFVGTGFWRIIKFALHQCLASEAPNDGLYHQTQAILRNSENGFTSVARLVSVLHAWRHHAHRPVRRILPLIVLTSVGTAAFAVASIFSASVNSGMSDEVLVAGDHCGQLWPGDPDLVNYDMIKNIFLPYTAKLTSDYNNYVQTCYTNSSKTGGCSFFIKRQIHSHADYNASCPFDEKICRNPDRNIKLDSGYLGIDSDLGFNLPPDLQYDLRVINHCAPLVTHGYQETFNYSNDMSYMRYLYGQENRNSTMIKDLNFTFESRIPSASQLRSEDSTSDAGDYRLQTWLSTTYNGLLDHNISSFLPIDELSSAVTDNDLSLIVLSAPDVVYSTEVDDDWYAAHRPYANLSSAQHVRGGKTSLFLSDEPASILGCKSHYQVCKRQTPPGQDCFVSGGYQDLMAPSISNEDPAYSLILWITNSFAPINLVIDSLTTSSLTSRSGLTAGQQGPLPSNQWQKEVENFHNIALNSLQRVTDSAQKPQDPNVLKYFWAAPNSTTQSYLCKNQKIRSASHSNFSILGLCILLIGGGLIIVLGYALEFLVSLIQTRLFGRVRYSQLEWSINDYLQMQRVAHEELGIGPWKDVKGVRAIPVTEKGQLLAVLDVQNPDHPRLKAIVTAENEHGEAEMIKSAATEVESLEKGKGDIVATQV
ncbi:MAG: hypothetical protein Q9160_005233 [Pyrenula sp. 1 TL-2023]